ncbi:hypothetical protein B0H17DRAFT_1140159 [Mycena rosella]|uniref:Uncharacterized protein n=1 Tax=Mycena rosella TaxID=1033263 RepID=A0AAD7GCA2_MYCRO|nr:hypothetical protein B0H17DRAFT_1140159 [Mycena rosella]
MCRRRGKQRGWRWIQMGKLPQHIPTNEEHLVKERLRKYAQNWPKPRLSTSDGALFKQLSGRLGDVVDAVRLKKKIGKPEKGKRKAGAVKADCDEEDSDFPEALGTS